MQGRRPERIAQIIRKEIGELLVARVKDPVVQGVTITDVRMTPDLSLARVFFAAKDDVQAKAIGKGLKRASAFLKRELGLALHLKKTPELRFERDEALEEGMHIDSILREISRPAGEEEP